MITYRQKRAHRADYQNQPSEMPLNKLTVLTTTFCMKRNKLEIVRGRWIERKQSRILSILKRSNIIESDTPVSFLIIKQVYVLDKIWADQSEQAELSGRETLRAWIAELQQLPGKENIMCFMNNKASDDFVEDAQNQSVNLKMIIIWEL